MSSIDEKSGTPDDVARERLPDSLVVAMRKSSRASLALTVLAAALISIGMLVGIWHGEQLEKQAERARNIADAKTTEAKSANKHADSLSAFVEGRTPSALLSGPSTLAGALRPTATFTRGLGVTHFTLGMSVAPGPVPGIQAVTYKLNPVFFSENTFRGSGSSFAAVVDTGACLSTVNADVTFTDGSNAKLTFDWCKLSNWNSSPEYDSSQVVGANLIHASCTSVRALLFEMPSAVFKQIGPVQLLRQVYRADKRWQATAHSSPVTFVGQRRSGDEKNMALVAKCHAPETCISLAAAYHAAAGGTPPNVQCGELAGFEKSEVAIPQLKDGMPASELAAASKWESCFRLTACEVASIGSARQYPLLRCVNPLEQPRGAVLDCAQRESCDDVLTCAAVAAQAP